MRHLLAQPARFIACHLLLLHAAVAYFPVYAQPAKPKLQLSVQAGPVIFDEIYQFAPASRYSISSSARVRKNCHAVLRFGFIPATQKFVTPAGAQTAEVNLYELAVGVKLDGPALFTSHLRAFGSLMGGVLLYRPQPAKLDLGVGGMVRMQPPNSTKGLFSAALGLDWQLAKAVALSIAVDASLSRIAERLTDGTARQRWRPIFSAAVGICGSIK